VEIHRMGMEEEQYTPKRKMGTGMWNTLDVEAINGKVSIESNTH
jgi:hypothetical protein